MKNESSYQWFFYCRNELLKVKKKKNDRGKNRDQYRKFFQYSEEKLQNRDLMYDSNTESWATAVYSN